MWYTYEVHFEGGGGKEKNEIWSDVGEWEVSECSGRPIFFFINIKEKWVCAMSRHHAEPNINILLTRNPALTLTSDSEATLEWIEQ